MNLLYFPKIWSSVHCTLIKYYKSKVLGMKTIRYPPKGLIGIYFPIQIMRLIERAFNQYQKGTGHFLVGQLVGVIIHTRESIYKLWSPFFLSKEDNRVRVGMQEKELKFCHVPCKVIWRDPSTSNAQSLGKDINKWNIKMKQIASPLYSM